MKTYKVTIKGVRPLLMNKWVEDNSIKKRGEVQDSAELCEHKLYKLNGKLVQPAEHIERAMEKVASSFKIKGAGKKTYKDLVQGAVFIQPEFIEHKVQKWVVDKRTVVIPSTKGRILRFRPRLDEWELDFTVQVLDDRVTPEILKLILDEAGRLKGIGDGRSIGFGRFIVTRFEEVKKS